MDASRKGTKRRKEEVEASLIAKRSEGEKFVWNGSWPGEKAVLAPENWEQIIKRFLWRTGDVFKNLYDFTPIRSLINCENRKCLHVTNQDILDLREGLDLNTHCRRIYDLHHSFSDISAPEAYVIRRTLLITRNKDWVIWNSEGIRTKLKRSKEDGPEARIFYKISRFEKIDSILPLLKDGAIGSSIVDSFYLMLDHDISRQEDSLARKKQARDLAKGIYDRAMSLRGG